MEPGSWTTGTCVRADGVYQNFPISKETPSSFHLVGRSPRPTLQPELRFLRTSASSKTSSPPLFGCSRWGQPESLSSELLPSSMRGLQLLRGAA